MIRIAQLKDAEALLKIYSYYIENTAITFEYNIPSLEEFQNRIGTTLEKFPYLVYEENGEILGYAYAASLIKRAAADWMAETSIYVKKDMLKQGIGKELYEALEQHLKHQNILKLIAVISTADRKDDYVSKNSVEFHQHMGYKVIGNIKNAGYKFDNWYDLVYMEKELGSFVKHPPKVIRLQEKNYD